MNDVDQMPPKCQNCPYWEIAEKPYCCGECSMKLFEITQEQINNRTETLQ